MGSFESLNIGGSAPLSPDIQPLLQSTYPSRAPFRRAIRVEVTSLPQSLSALRHLCCLRTSQSLPVA